MSFFSDTDRYDDSHAEICQMQHELDIAHDELDKLQKAYDNLKSKLDAVDLASDDDFERWWKLYDKKRGKKQVKKYWLKNIKSEDLDDIVKHTILYVANTDKNFRKDAIRYLRHEAWNDEVIERIKTKEEIDRENSIKADKEAKKLSLKSNYPQEIEEDSATQEDIREILSRRNWGKK